MITLAKKCFTVLESLLCIVAESALEPEALGAQQTTALGSISHRAES